MFNLSSVEQFFVAVRRFSRKRSREASVWLCLELSPLGQNGGRGHSDGRHWRCRWFAPGAHLAIVLPPGMIRFGSGRLLLLGRGLPGSYCLNWNRVWSPRPSHRPTAIANLKSVVFPFAHRD